MASYCLCKNDIEVLLHYKAYNHTVTDDSLAGLIQNAENWYDELGCLSYLLAQIFERKLYTINKCSAFIDLVYKIPEEMFLTIHEIDLDFISLMLRSIRNNQNSLEEDLLEFQIELMNYDWTRKLRL